LRKLGHIELFVHFHKTFEREKEQEQELERRSLGEEGKG